MSWRPPGLQFRAETGESVVHDDSRPVDLYESGGFQGRDNHAEISQEEVFQLSVGDVARGDQQQFFGFAAEMERIHEIRVLGHHDPVFSFRDLDERSVSGPIALGKLQRMHDIVALLAQPPGCPTRELRVDEEIHAASGSILLIRVRRVA